MRSIVLLALVLVLAGCSKEYLASKYGEAAPVVVSNPVQKVPDKGVLLHAWHPYTTLALANDKGEFCPLPADGAKIGKSEKNIGLNLSGMGTLPGVGVNADSTRQDFFNLITAEDSRGSFAETMLSYLCIMRMNSWMDNDMVSKKFDLVVDKAAGMAIAGTPANTPAAAPAEKSVAEAKPTAKTAQKKP